MFSFREVIRIYDVDLTNILHIFHLILFRIRFELKLFGQKGLTNLEVCLNAYCFERGASDKAD